MIFIIEYIIEFGVEGIVGELEWNIVFMIFFLYDVLLLFR